MPSLKDLYNRGIVEIVDDNTSLGNGFEKIRFSGVPVDVTDAGDNTAIVNITGGTGGSGDPNVGILAHWNFNEPNDTPRVDSVSNIQLLEVNNPGVSSGILGNAVNFSGTGGKLLRDEDNTILSINNIDWTISFWLKMVKPAVSTGDKPIILISKDSGGDREYHIQYQAGDAWADGSQGIYLMINGNPLIKLIDSTFIQNNTWQLVTVTHDVSTKQVSGYLNTTQRGSGVYSASTVVGNADFWVGQTTNLNSATVEIDEVGIWSRILNSSDVVEIYNGGNGDEYPYTISEVGGTGSALTVKNSTGSTVVNNVDTITVSGLLLSDEGNGDITLFSGGGGQETIDINGLVYSHHTLNETTSDYLDSTTNDVDLEVVGNVTRNSSGEDGSTGFIEFGTDGYLKEIQGNNKYDNFNADSWTFSTRIKFLESDLGKNTSGGIVSRDSINTGREFDLYFFPGDNNNPKGYYFTLNDSIIFYYPVASIPQDIWHTITITKNLSTSTCKFFIDGEKKLESPIPPGKGNVTGTTPLTLGSIAFYGNGVNYFFPGLKMEEFVTWTRVLSESEVAYHNGLTPDLYPFSVLEPEPIFTFSNKGTGEGEVFKDVAGSEVQYRKIKAGSNISISQTANEITINSTGGGGSGGTTQFNLQEFTNTTQPIGDGESQDMEITGELSLLLAAIETNVPSMVRVYTSSAARLEDTRVAGEPIVNTIEGLVLEVETTTDDLRIDLSSIVAFINLESPQTRSIYLRVFNQSGQSENIEVKVIGSTVGVAIPGTTKGDMLVHDGTQYQVLSVGVDGYKLVSDSTSLTGVRWVEDDGGFSPPGDSKGDILVYDGSEYVKVPIGVSGQGLQVDPNEPTGVKWANFKTGGGGIGDTFIPAQFLGKATLGVLTWGNVDAFGKRKTIIDVEYKQKTFKALNSAQTENKIITDITELN